MIVRITTNSVDHCYRKGACVVLVGRWDDYPKFFIGWGVDREYGGLVEQMLCREDFDLLFGRVEQDIEALPLTQLNIVA